MKIAWGSCMIPSINMSGGFVALSRNIEAFFALGDMPYTDGGRTAFGITANNTATDQSVSNFTAHHLQARANPGFKELFEQAKCYYMWDDHEFPGDNYDSSVDNMNSGNGEVIPNVTTQAQVDAIWENARDAAAPFLALNPANTDSEAVAEKCPNSTLTDADYPPRYFRVTHDDTEFFMLDCMSHRSPVRDTDDASKTMLGSAQKAWLKARLLASTADYKIIVSPKSTHALAGSDNTDKWSPFGVNLGYTTERDEILQYIEDNSITTVVWISGDRHTPNVTAMSLADTEPFDHVDVCGCPIGVDINAGVSTAGTYTKFIDRTAQVIGVAETSSTHLSLKLVNLKNKVIWSGVILKGTNYLSGADSLSVSI